MAACTKIRQPCQQRCHYAVKGRQKLKSTSLHGSLVDMIVLARDWAQVLGGGGGFFCVAAGIIVVRQKRSKKSAAAG